MMWPQTHEGLQPPEAGRGEEQGLRGEWGPADTLLSDWPPEPCMNAFLLFQAPWFVVTCYSRAGNQHRSLVLPPTQPVHCL